jgi:phosphatidylserine/phosphatidylglycerophosphate/cardiolipin synthase-like enzyme
MSADFQVMGTNADAAFTLKVHRGEGMALLAMNWRGDQKPPKDFVGFAIDYKEPGGDRFFTLKNRLNFLGPNGKVSLEQTPTLLAPIQKFRWVHFPRNAELPGDFLYRVTPVFMNERDELSYGPAQEVAIELRRETYPGELNVAFTRGFVLSQAFVDKYEPHGKFNTLIPTKADDGLTFKPTHPDRVEALDWMGFEARNAILDVLDQAIADTTAEVRVVAYDLSEPGVVSRLAKLGKRLKIIIDDEGSHGTDHSGELQAEEKLVASAGRDNVKRQHMGNLQHNKTIVVDGSGDTKLVVCGSTNFSWRGFFVQSNNALILRGRQPVQLFLDAFDAYWAIDDNDPDKFRTTPPAKMTTLGLKSVNARVAFSPHGSTNVQLTKIADDMRKTKSSLLYSLAFLSQTEGAVRDAITALTKDKSIFVYGIADKEVEGIDVQVPGESNPAPVMPTALSGKKVPEPFKSEPKGGSGNRMHHKFVVIDFDKPTARVYLGSYNFSDPADTSNGENLLLIRDRRIATSYAVEALRIFDHYHFRVLQDEKPKSDLHLAKPPRATGEKPWWDEDYRLKQKIRDRELFS